MSMTPTQKEYLEWVVWRNGFTAITLVVPWIIALLFAWKWRAKKDSCDMPMVLIPIFASVLFGFFITQNVLGIIKAKTAPSAYLDSYWNTGELNGVK